MIRALTPADDEAATRLLDRVVAGRHQARLGEVHDVLALPGFAAVADGELVGVATFQRTGERAELAVLVVDAGQRRRGLGTALIDAVAEAAKANGAAELWLVTTNDNLTALDLYQRRGFRLSALHAGAVERSRAVKPSIPEIGQHGIPLRDELVLVRALT